MEFAFHVVRKFFISTPLGRHSKPAFLVRKLTGSLPLLLAAVIACSCSGAAGKTAETVGDLIQRSARRGLHCHPYWHVLMHYVPGTFGTRSLIDDPDFFLATGGKTNPQAELEAAVRRFFGDDDPDDRTETTCRFIARYTWLAAELDVVPQSVDVCGAYRDFVSELAASRVVLVFPTTSMNSPASMFGHTLLALDQDGGSRLLSYAVDYSARTEEKPGILFALKGIFGHYRGTYGILPYYEKVRDYSDIDSRDIREYELNLSLREIDRLVMHLWELNGVESRYYFFKENCAYNLLFLLDVARPGLALHRNFRGWTLPVDTIRAVRDAGLVERSEFRPSRRTRINRLAARLPARDVRRVQKILSTAALPSEAMPLAESAEADAHMLDLVIAGAQHRFGAGDWSQATYRKVFLDATRLRSERHVAVDADEDVLPPPLPERGHATARLKLALGAVDSEMAAEVEFRPAYHSLDDPVAGYAAGAEIAFLETRFRFGLDHGGAVLQQLQLIDIVSLASRNGYFRPMSWTFALGVERLQTQTGRHHIAALTVGGGHTWQLGDTSLVYGLLQTRWQGGRALADGYAGGAGARLGWTAEIGRYWYSQLSGEILSYGVGDRHRERVATLAVRYRWNKAIQLGIDVVHADEFHRHDTRALVNCTMYY